MKESDNDQGWNQIQFVLVRPTHPGNIGGVARAMKTMGLCSLRLVLPTALFPSDEASRRAAGAGDLLDRAEVHEGLDDAISDCHLIIGTTARRRAVDWPGLSPREAAKRLYQECSSGPVALLFGQERSGLNNHEVERCHYLVSIPTSPGYSSLNLASAAQIMAYELFLQHCDPSYDLQSAEDADYASEAQMRLFYRHLEETLLYIDFPNARPPVKLMRKLVRLFNRARPSQEDLQILRGILSAVQEYTKKI